MPPQVHEHESNADMVVRETDRPSSLDVVDEMEDTIESKNVASVPRHLGRRVLWTTVTFLLVVVAVGLGVGLLTDLDLRRSSTGSSSTESSDSADPVPSPTLPSDDAPSSPALLSCQDSDVFCFDTLGDPIRPEATLPDDLGQQQQQQQQQQQHRPWNLVLSETGNVLAVSHRGESWARIYQWNADAKTWFRLGNDIVGEVPFLGLALSQDGTTVALGGPLHSTNSVNKRLSGHVLVYSLAEDAGTGQAYWKQRGSEIVGQTAYDQLGSALALSDDGTVLAIGAPFQEYGASPRVGQVHTFRYARNDDEGDWQPMGSPIVGNDTADQFGSTLSLSADGRSLVASARFHDTVEHDNAGLIQAYRFESGRWIAAGKPIEGASDQEELGYSLALSGNGMTMAVGTAHKELRIYQYQSDAQFWSLSSTHKLRNDDGDDTNSDNDSLTFVSLSTDGQTAAVLERKRSADDSIAEVRVWTATASWQLLTTNLSAEALALSGDGRVVAVAAGSEVRIVAAEQ